VSVAATRILLKLVPSPERAVLQIAGWLTFFHELSGVKDSVVCLKPQMPIRLPAHFRARCEGVVLHIEDYATDEVLDAMGIQSELDLMGLFQGVGLPFQSESAPVQMPNMVWLYRVPILLYWAEHDESLGAIITHVLVHEIGHHFGLSDDDMYGIERAAE